MMKTWCFGVGEERDVGGMGGIGITRGVWGMRREGVKLKVIVLRVGQGYG